MFNKYRFLTRDEDPAQMPVFNMETSYGQEEDSRRHDFSHAYDSSSREPNSTIPSSIYHHNGEADDIYDTDNEEIIRDPMMDNYPQLFASDQEGYNSQQPDSSHDGRYYVKQS